MRSFYLAAFAALCSFFFKEVAAKGEKNGDYLVGTGIYDMTGPAAQINLMGYARGTQNAHGIHLRLRARAFIVAERPSAAVLQAALEQEASVVQAKSRLRWNWKHFRREPQDTTARPGVTEALHADPNKTICFVSIDAGMGSDLLNTRVLKRLEELLPEQHKDGKRLCHLENLSISGTHTHSAPAGFIQYTLYQVTSLGFSEEVMSAYSEGVAQAILRAYNNLQPGSVNTAQEFLFEANINRSPSSYLLNPAAERDEYAIQGNTDKTMLQVSFTAAESGQALGVLNWFAVHGTSMNSSNLLISGDNKGYASYLLEKRYNGNETFPGHGNFVAAFASSNLGDVSPNTAGPRCIDTGLPCDFKTSTCNGKTELCIAFGPGQDMFESTEIIGRKQYEHATRLLENKTSQSVTGEIAYRHSFIDMSDLNVTLDNGDIVHTCPAALGYSFAGGTTDGPGDFDFTQGRNTSNPFWNMLAGFLSTPSAKQIECQAPKPILLNTGRATLPYDWDPNTIPISIFRVGQVFILSVPCEFTTMAGRRLRKAVRQILVDGGIEDPVITIAGLANSYTHYVTTIEEYAGQRYEAASTLYGPYTLEAYIQEFRRITTDLVNGLPSESSKAPRDLSKKQISLLPPVEFDAIGFGKEFGSVAKDAGDKYSNGETVIVSFRSANPRNDQRIEGTFLTVDVLDDDGQWQTRYVDGDWCTKFHWKGTLGNLGPSFAEIHWKIPEETPRGLYRICHYGTRKTLLGGIEAGFFRLPAWVTSNVFGSYAVNMLYQTVELAIALSESLQTYVGKLGRSRFSDFEGCSRTFLVHPKTTRR